MNEALYYIGLTQAIFVSFVLLTKKRKQNSDLVLTIWLLTIAFKMLVLLVGSEYGDFFDDQFSLALIPLTFGPFLFIYTKNLIYQRGFLGRFDLVHFIPFLILTIMYFTFFKGKIDLETPFIFKADGMALVRIVYGTSFILSIAYYTFMTYYLLNRYRKHLSDNFSYFSGKNELSWLYYLTGTFALTYLFYALLGSYNLILGESRFDISVISDGGLVLLTFLVSFFGIKQPYLFKDPDKSVESVVDTTTGVKAKSAKYKQSNLTKEQKEEYVARLMAHMLDERPFLDPELTVQDLSKQVNIARHHLTEILNNDIGKNFFTFINEYRIKEVKKRLLDERFDHLTIIAIAYDCGFNSKSTFNSIFKQQTGSTPSKWKASMQMNEQQD